MTALSPNGRVSFSSSQLTAICVCGAVAIFALALAGLYALGRPSELAQTLQSLDLRLGRLEAGAQNADQAFAYPKGAVCSGSPEVAAHDVQAALSALTARTKLAAASSSASLAAVDGRLQPMDVALDGNGDYGAAISTVQGLAKVQPLLLLDRVDLVSKGTYLHLHVSGRAYCWSPGRP